MTQSKPANGSVGSTKSDKSSINTTQASSTSSLPKSVDTAPSTQSSPIWLNLNTGKPPAAYAQMMDNDNSSWGKPKLH
ncbi:uncharacterized protein STEHIDRAFT_161555 [Stereum hirsutum FP-91666 SS1]|uniref:uncharacterized protein n=1 Tax=Stereum hirsutum (strain FP-91666) TaxID=721885 RepID=UPI000444A15F|nr:uncharacterized protein STEHIDRAFT_161555 [Stereum hirsutum FP-91666 SS1]EIM81364.1 hypothetical protein STEHIDRAFT_161555 [Stereum hirsutum FP-91666 SS1]